MIVPNVINLFYYRHCVFLITLTLYFWLMLAKNLYCSFQEQCGTYWFITEKKHRLMANMCFIQSKILKYFQRSTLRTIILKR